MVPVIIELVPTMRRISFNRCGFRIATEYHRHWYDTGGGGLLEVILQDNFWKKGWGNFSVNHYAVDS
jgi:hypothetical protein